MTGSLSKHNTPCLHDTLLRLSQPWERRFLLTRSSVSHNRPTVLTVLSAVLTATTRSGRRWEDEMAILLRIAEAQAHHGPLQTRRRSDATSVRRANWPHLRQSGPGTTRRLRLHDACSPPRTSSLESK
ncbi:hypothetical protein ACOMHN_056635 [Nucella lapillus]